MSGHVFVALSDITRLRCDAWLLPSDASLHITPAWIEAAPRAKRVELAGPHLRERWERRASTRTLPLDPWYTSLGDAPAPVPILTDIGAWVGKDVLWYLDGLSEFIQTASRLAQCARSWRSKPLFAVPFIGAGAGGKATRKGEMQHAILERLEHEANVHDVDLVLVLANKVAFTAAQAVRRKTKHWDLNHPERERLDALGSHASHGRLVLFLGAGLGRATGLPLWSELIDQLAAGESSSEKSALQSLSPLDAAAILERRFRSQGRNFRRETARLTATPCFGLGHALVAALPVKERVTTNYDECIETSLRAAGHTLSVLPYSPIRSEGSWLLKLHGTISLPEQIVITRQDYLRYENHRGALYGIVQAMMLTRHILFLGFSLRDENFHSLVDEVRLALEGVTSPNDGRIERFGTAFVPNDNTTAAQLWDNEIHIEQLGMGASHPRELEIALDYLGFITTSAADYLLDETFSAILTDEQRELKAILRELIARLPERHIASPTFAPLTEFLARFGGGDEREAPRASPN